MLLSAQACFFSIGMDNPEECSVAGTDVRYLTKNKTFFDTSGLYPDDFSGVVIFGRWKVGLLISRSNVPVVQQKGHPTQQSCVRVFLAGLIKVLSGTELMGSYNRTA